LANYQAQIESTEHIKKVRELAVYWRKQNNWRAKEARINHFDQFTTEIDGQQIHFIHHAGSAKIS